MISRTIQYYAGLTIIVFLLAVGGYSQTSIIKKPSNDSLWRDTSNLKDVVISASIQKPVLQMSGNKITLNVESSPVYSTNNVYDILKEMPGISEISNQLQFRMKSVAIYIDGKIYRGSDDDIKNILSSMPGVIIQKVEINTAPSAKYDAQGGTIINIITKRKKDKGVAGTIDIENGFGRYNQGGAGGLINYKNGRLNVYGSYNYGYNKTYTNTYTTRYLTGGNNLFQQDSAKMKNNTNTYRLGADYEINAKATAGIEILGFYNTQNRNTDDNTSISTMSSITTSTGYSYISNPTLSGYYKIKTDSVGSELEVNASYLFYDKHWNDNFNTDYMNSQSMHTGYSFLRDYSPADNNIKIISVDYSHPTTAGNFGIGAKTTLTKTDNNIVWDSLTNNNWYVDSAYSNHFIYHENIFAGYLTYSKAIKDKWQIDAGIRGEATNTTGELLNSQEKTKRHYFNLFPNLSVSYIKNLNNIFNFSYVKSINRFGFDIVNPFIKYQSQYSYTQGNPDIQPQIDHSFNFVYTYNQCLMLGASETHSLNAIGPVFYGKGSDTTIMSYTNFKSSDLFYVFANFSKKVTDYWTPTVVFGTGNYKYNTSTSQFYNAHANRTWSYLIQFNNTISIRNLFKIEWDNFLQGPMASGIYKLHTIAYSNIGLSKQILKNKGSIKLSLTDIFNSNVQKFDINYNDVDMNIRKKQESRFIKLQFTYSFGNNKYKDKSKNNNDLDDVQKRLQ